MAPRGVSSGFIRFGEAKFSAADYNDNTAYARLCQRAPDTWWCHTPVTEVQAGERGIPEEFTVSKLKASGQGKERITLIVTFGDGRNQIVTDARPG